MQLTPQQIRKIDKIAKLIDEGNLAIAQFIFELEEKIENEIPNINSIIAKVKGDKGDSYVLTDEDKKEISNVARQLLNDNEIAQAVLERIDLRQIAKQASEYIKVPSPKEVDIVKLKKDIKPQIISEVKKELKDEIISSLPKVENGKDSKPEDVAKILETNLIKNLPQFGVQYRDGLELLPVGEKLTIEAVENLREELNKINSEDRTRIVGANKPLSGLLDVDMTGLTTNQSIKWDGVKWIPYTPTDLDEQDLQDVTDNGATTTNESTFSGGLITNNIKGVDTSGIKIENHLGDDVALLGAGGSQGSTFYGQINSPNLNITSSGSTTPLVISKASETGVKERLFTASVSDHANASFFINNGTLTDGVFAPVFGGYTDSTTLWPLGFGGYVSSTNDASDSSSYGLVDIGLFRTTNSSDPLNGTLSSIQNRKLFTIRNNSTTAMTVTAGGYVGFGTLTPSERVVIEGAGVTRLLVRDSVGTGALRAVASGLDAFIGSDSGDLYLQTAATNRMLINSVGAATLYSTLTLPNAAITIGDNTSGAYDRSMVFRSPSGYGSYIDVFRNNSNRWRMSFGSTDVFSLIDQTTATTRLSLTLGGNLGIGTAGATSPLHIVSSASDSILIDLQHLNDPAIRLGRTTHGTVMRHTTGPTDYFGIAVKESSQPTVSTTPQFVFTSGGRMGIGTLTPRAPLEIYADSLSNVGSFLFDQPTAPTGSTNKGPHFFMKSAGADRGWVGFFDSANHGNGTQLNLKSAGNVGIAGGSVGAANQITLIGSTGNVGIGTASPENKLHVQGNISTGGVSSAIYAGWGNNYVNIKEGIPGTINTYNGFGINVNNSATRALTVDNTGNIGIGTTTPSAKTHIISTTEQLRIGYDTSNYYTTTVGSTGGVTFNAVGSGSKFVFSDSVEATTVKATTAGGFVSSDGSTGFTGTGSYTSFTIKDGIIISAI